MIFPLLIISIVIVPKICPIRMLKNSYNSIGCGPVNAVSAAHFETRYYTSTLSLVDTRQRRQARVDLLPIID